MPVPKALVASGLMREEDLAEFMARLFGIPFVSLAHRRIPAEVMALVPRSLAENFQVVPLERDEHSLTLAVADPFDVVSEDVVRLMTGLQIRKVVATPSDILNVLAGKAPDLTGEVTGILERLSTPEIEVLAQAEEERHEEPVEPGAPTEHTAPIIQLVNALVVDAIQMKASDIHVEPMENCLRVRYRIDGVLRVMCELPKNIQSAVLSRFKLASGMDIAEKRRPQDGRSRVRVQGRSVDLRVSSLPSFHGEKIVARILDKEVGVLSLEGLGFLPDDFQRYMSLVRNPQGMVLITGPTGSGKTTTLYATLNERNRTTDNIVTVEDPIEFQLPGVTQLQVNPRVGITFASALRHILRQDPDIVMVGEIRDLETAEIAFQAAQTGHFVLSTLHTNSAPATIIRLHHMGVVPYLTASSLLGVVAQRLVRRLCPHCQDTAPPDPRLMEYIRQATDAEIPERWPVGRGCQRCGMTGYRGRTGLFEVLPLTDRLKDAIYRRASQQRINRLAGEEGFRSLLEDGLLKVAQGITSVQEVLRVVTIEPRSRRIRGGRADADHYPAPASVLS
jgi:type IV pilus assembly protein PilB